MVREPVQAVRVVRVVPSRSARPPSSLQASAGVAVPRSSAQFVPSTSSGFKTQSAQTQISVSSSSKKTGKQASQTTRAMNQADAALTRQASRASGSTSTFEPSSSFSPSTPTYASDSGATYEPPPAQASGGGEEYEVLQESETQDTGWSKTWLIGGAVALGVGFFLWRSR